MNDARVIRLLVALALVAACGRQPARPLANRAAPTAQPAEPAEPAQPASAGEGAAEAELELPPANGGSGSGETVEIDNKPGDESDLERRVKDAAKGASYDDVDFSVEP